MSLIARYLLGEFLTASGTVLLALFVTWLAADSLMQLDTLSTAPGAGTRLILFRALEMLPIGVPIACLAGVVWSLSRAVRSREITAIRCGGIPLRRVLLPILGVSLLISAFLILIEDRVIVPTRHALAQSGEEGEAARRRPVQLGQRWWYASGSSIFSAERYDAAAGVLHGVTVFKLDRDREIAQRIDAEEAVNTKEQTWEFRSIRIYDFDRVDRVVVRQEERTTLDLGISEQDLARAGPAPEHTTLHRLARRIRKARDPEAVRFGLIATFHQRIAQPLAVLVLVLLALPFALGDTERGDSLPRALVQALSVCGLFWLVWALAVLAGRSGVLPPAFPLWGTLLLFLAAGSWRFQRIQE
ncbi:MAG: LptF/LptG family permease [Myxococcota bacterium]